MTQYEYGIMELGGDPDEDPMLITNMSESEATAWLEKCEGRGYVLEDLRIVRRVVGPWKGLDEPDLKRPKPRPGVVWASPLNKRIGW